MLTSKSHKRIYSYKPYMCALLRLLHEFTEDK